MNWQPELTRDIRNAIFDAYAEAQRVDDDHINTEHLLLGLLRDESNRACCLLRELNIRPTDIRAEVEGRLASRYLRTRLDVPLTPRADRVLQLTYEMAKDLEERAIHSGHLLLALLKEGQGLAAIALAEQGVTISRVGQLLGRPAATVI